VDGIRSRADVLRNPARGTPSALRQAELLTVDELGYLVLEANAAHLFFNFTSL
jgi:DNA replication protein DnaC